MGRPDWPERRLYHGRPTGSAMPLMWAHAEFIKLLRSRVDGHVFDRPPEVEARYRDAHPSAIRWEVWKPNRQIRRVTRGSTLRIQAPALFTLRWSSDEWRTVNDTVAFSTAIGVSCVDIAVALEQVAPIVFTFRWKDGWWEGRNYEVAVDDA